MKTITRFTTVVSTRLVPIQGFLMQYRKDTVSEHTEEYSGRALQNTPLEIQ